LSGSTFNQGNRKHQFSARNTSQEKNGLYSSSPHPHHQVFYNGNMLVKIKTGVYYKIAFNGFASSHLGLTPSDFAS
jgi:hypothetical protein